MRMADRKEEIIRLQNQIIQQMTGRNLKNIGRTFGAEARSL